MKILDLNWTHNSGLNQFLFFDTIGILGQKIRV